ncbi:MAG: carbohydrate kinase family protein [Limnohabitans sp.]
MTVSVWVLGEALMDCVAQPDTSLRPMMGGSPFNLACAVALQAVDVGYLSPFSNDVFGQALSQRLAETGAKAMGKTSRKPTSLAVINMHNGQPSYGFYRDGIADRDYNAEDIVSQLKQHAPGVLHTGSLMAMPPEHHKVMHVIQFAKALGWTISIDVNLRTRVAYDLPAYLDAVNRMAGLADWLKASDEDMQLLGWRDVNWDNIRALAAQWHALGCQRVALTFGATGASLHIASPSAVDSVSLQAKAAAPAVNVVDTVGAGDTFWGSCLADWVLHDTVGNDGLAASRADQTLQRALKGAAINCERVGCQPPTEQELMKP